MTSPDPWIAASRTDLLAGVTSHVTVDPGDARSGSVFEQVTIDGQPHFAKTLGYRTDWIMRVTGDRDLRTLKIWRAGIMRDAPPEIDHAVVGMAADGEGEDALLTILMRDIGEHLCSRKATRRSRSRTISVCSTASPRSRRGTGAGPTTSASRRSRNACGSSRPTTSRPRPRSTTRRCRSASPCRDGRGSPNARPRSPSCSPRSTPRPAALADAMRSTPATFLHGDWKMGNLGRHRDGRTILLDWAYPGSGPVLLGSRLVSRVEQRAAADRQGSHDRGAARRARTARRADERLVRPATRPVPARHGGVFRLGEGDGRRRRAALVGGARATEGARHVADGYPPLR